MSGYTRADHLSNEQLASFLLLVREGVPIWSAAKQIEPPTSTIQIYRRAGRDAGFDSAFRFAREVGMIAFKEALRAELLRRSFPPE